MSIAGLVALIANLCGPNNQPTLNKEQRIDCYEYYTNCSVGSNGEINVKKLGECCKMYSKRSLK